MLRIRIMLLLLYYGPDTDFVKENGLPLRIHSTADTVNHIF